VISIKTTTETIESKGGLLLAGKIARKSGLLNIHSPLVKKAGTIITSLFGLMTEGKTAFESIDEKRGKIFFKEALELPFVYAKETVRLYLEKMTKDTESIIGQLKESAVKIIRKGQLHGLWIEGRQYLPVDIDTTTLDNSNTKKEGVSRTYRGFDGYHPITAYVGKEGYMLNSELRPGSQHCQKETVSFIKEVIQRLRGIKTFRRHLLRLDSGNDAFATLKTIIEAGKGYYFLIKRNRRKENDEIWLKIAKQYGKKSMLREGKKVWFGTAPIHPSKKGETLKDVRCVFEVIERKIDRKGNRLLFPEIEVNSWWTNLDCDEEKVIMLYHGHATSEQFHGELKHDMGIERLPSGKLKVNKILFAVAMNAYNALRLIGQTSKDIKGRTKFRRKRLGKVIRDLICVAGKFVRHAGSFIFKLHDKDPVLPIFLRLNTLLDSS
jgi:hypothetical protein